MSAKPGMTPPSGYDSVSEAIAALLKRTWLNIVDWFDAYAVQVMMSREPDEIIGPLDNPYLLRWKLLPPNRIGNVYIHEFRRSDDDRALHDHPRATLGLILSGSYIEHTKKGASIFEKGRLKYRSATYAHRVELRTNTVRSLFAVGPKTRMWGFHTDNGWVPWYEFEGGQ